MSILEDVLSRPVSRETLLAALEAAPRHVVMPHGAFIAPVRPLPAIDGVFLVPAALDGAHRLAEVERGRVRRLWWRDGPFFVSSDRGSAVALRYPFGPGASSDGPVDGWLAPDGVIEPVSGPIAARSVFEAHAYMSVRGVGDTRHAMRAEGGRLLDVHEAPTGRVFRFDVADPRGRALGDLLGPVELVLLADQRARTGRRADLEDARLFLERLRQLIPREADRVPAAAFRAPPDEPGRFTRARLDAVAAAWDRLLAPEGA